LRCFVLQITAELRCSLYTWWITVAHNWEKRQHCTFS